MGTDVVLASVGIFSFSGVLPAYVTPPPHTIAMVNVAEAIWFFVGFAISFRVFKIGSINFSTWQKYSEF